ISAQSHRPAPAAFDAERPRPQGPRRGPGARAEGVGFHPSAPQGRGTGDPASPAEAATLVLGRGAGPDDLTAPRGRRRLVRIRTKIREAHMAKVSGGSRRDLFRYLGAGLAAVGVAWALGATPVRAGADLHVLNWQGYGTDEAWAVKAFE